MNYDGPSNLRALLFDHDGTLVDSEVVHYKFWAEVLAGLQQPFTEDDYRLHYVGVSELRTAEDIRRRFAITATVAELVAQKRAIAQRFHLQSHYPMMPGVAETLAWLADRSLHQAVVSGSARFALEANLRALGVLHQFTCVVSGEEVPNNKPAPDVYLSAVDQLRMTPDHCLALEDTRAGLLAAKAAGIFTCVIPNRYSVHHDFSEADRHFASMTAFLNWLKTCPTFTA